MGHDPVRVENTRDWLIRAASDLRAAEIDFAATPPLLGDIAFHSQQAIEKALKAFLTWYDEPFRRTHDLAELGAQCVEIDATLDPLVRRAASISEYAWRFRYPGKELAPAPEQAVAALALSREVVDAVLARLPDVVRP